MTEQTMAVFKQNEVASASSEGVDEISGGSGLPRLQLMTSASDIVKAGEFPVNAYSLTSGSDHIELGKNIDVVIIANRATAFQANDEVGYISSHDFKSPIFKDIMKIADAPGAYDRGDGAMYGPEFLVWVPEKKALATLFCGNKSARNMAASITACLGQVATLGSQKIETKKFTWFTMSCSPSNAEITNFPEADMLAAATEAFLTEKGVEPELAEKADQETDDR